MIVTIDGPAGAGKSSAARQLARRLGFDFLDTGAMYRAVALHGLRRGCNFASESMAAELLSEIRLELPGDQVLLNGEDISPLIRAPEITAASGPVASSKIVRARLVEWQRQIAENRDIVCEGRDQGTVAFPRAECKFFLFADPVERARRRHRELEAKGQQISFDEILQSQQARDARDAARDVGPMVAAADAISIDSSQHTLDEVVEKMERLVRERMLRR